MRRLVTLGDSSLAAGGGRIPRLSAAVSFFYYEDLGAAVSWYEQRLGLTKRFDDGWVVIFALASGSYLGLVDARDGLLQPEASGDKGSILALETPDLEDWYARLEHQGDIRFVTPLSVASKGLTEQFKILDPGGYIIEFFRWRETPAGAVAAKGSDPA